DFHLTGVQTCALPISKTHIHDIGSHPRRILKTTIDAISEGPVPRIEGRRTETVRRVRHNRQDTNPPVHARDADARAAFGSDDTEIGRACCRERGWNAE